MANSRITSRMKVYRTRIGFHDWIVAASSQKAALEAWDLHNKDLFASGAARVVNGADEVELAMKTPGIPVIAPGQGKLRVPDAPAKAVKKQPKAELRLVEKSEPEPDRSMLEAAEEALRRFEKKSAARLASLEARKAELEVEIDDVSAEATRERRRLQQQVEKERKRLA